MTIYIYSVTILSLFMVAFKLGHIKGSKGEKYNMGEMVSLSPFLLQLIAGIAIIINNGGVIS
jgi:hypothetical protein